MTVDSDLLGARGHPSPHRHRVGSWQQAFALSGGPLAWFLQLVATYALASTGCARPPALAGWGTLLTINILAMLVALAASLVAFGALRSTRRQHPGDSGELLEAGEGRARFLAICGSMTGLGFFAATVFDTICLLVMPPCIG